MEKLLHYAWGHKMFPLHPLLTDAGESVDVIDPGLLNNDAGPDFFNAKIKLDGMLWVGNVELHLRASDWYRHGHDHDAAYNNVILHVCSDIDCEVRTQDGRVLPQLQFSVPQEVVDNYEELLAEQKFPPCYRVIPSVPEVVVHSWLAALTAERFESKTQRIEATLTASGGDWERTAFVTLARGFGFGINAEAFDEWGHTVDLHAAAKHRDDALQVEAIFMGQAGLLDNEIVPEAHRDDYFLRLQNEYNYLAHKFSLRAMDGRHWRFLRLRPQNFPYVRLAQLTTLFCDRRTGFMRLVEATDVKTLRALLAVGVTDYWQTHYSFSGKPSAAHSKQLRDASLDLLIINTVAPLFFAYGRHALKDELCDFALELLETTKAEQNFITRSWAAAGIRARSAADSQALIHLRRNYCDPKDCLRCRFGAAYLKQRGAPGK